MKLQLIAVGTKMPQWVTTAFKEYCSRFPKDMPLELIEIPAGKRTKNADITRILDKEGEQMLANCGKGNRIVTLDIPGKPLTSENLSNELEKWKIDGRDVSLLIGGPEGLSKLVIIAINPAPSISESYCCRESLSRMEH